MVLPRRLTHLISDMVLQGRPANDPLVSPILGDFTGAAPIWICVGDTEILHDDARLMAQRLRGQGVETTLVIEQDLPHVWPLFHNFLPEARSTLVQVACWITSLTARLSR